MEHFKTYLQKQGLTGRSLVTVPSALRSIMKKLDTTDPVVIVSKRDEIKKLLLGNTYSPSTVNGYCMSLKHAVRWMDLGAQKTRENEEFYSKIGAEAMAAYKTLKNPNRQIRQKGARTEEALEVFQARLKEAKERTEAEEKESTPAFVPTKAGFRRQARINIPQEAVEAKNLDIFQRIDRFTPTLLSNRGEPIQDTTKTLYSDNIKLVIERYNIHRKHEGKADLDFIVTEVQKVIEWLDTLPINTRKAFETAIVKFLALADATNEQRQEAYENYTKWLKNQDYHPAARRKNFFGKDYTTGDKKKEYTWKLLIKNVDHILKHEKPTEVQRMFMLLFTKQAPRRSKDYTHMIVSDVDDKVNNIFMPHQKRFVFNFYKNISKSGPQTIDIKDDGLVRSLNEYIKSHPGQKYLFEKKDGTPLNKGDVQKIMRDNIGKRFGIPFGVNPLRHLFASYLHEFKHPKDLEEYARQMGTSSKMLNLHYIDADEKELDDDTPDEEVQKTKAVQKDNVVDLTGDDDVIDLSRVFETKEERVKRQKLESQRKVRATEKGKEQMRKDNAKRKEAKAAFARVKRG